MAEPNCPRCGGTGWKTVETVDAQGKRRVAVPCDCAAADRATRLLERTRIPKRYLHCDFDNFDIGLYGGEPGGAESDRSLEQARLIVQSFARDYPIGIDTGLLLVGPCGVGKTHLAVAALKQIVMRGCDGRFYDYWQLLKEIQASYDPVNQTTEMSVLEPVLSTELLLLDDLGASKPSAWALETVGLILKTRYNEKRITILTTHYRDSNPEFRDAPESSSNPAVPLGKEARRATFRQRRAELLPSGQAVPLFGQEALSERVGEHIRSRLYEMCRTVEIIAPDYRKRIRQAGHLRA